MQREWPTLEKICGLPTAEVDARRIFTKIAATMGPDRKDKRWIVDPGLPSAGVLDLLMTLWRRR